jgi:hypothetical protein
MSLNELLEAAQLDALGLLDPEEQQAFENAFAGASPAVRAQVRQEQSRLCRLESILPAALPDPSLRDKVLNRVSAAMAADTMARIVASPEGEPVEAIQHEGGRVHPPILRSRRVSSLWRAGALGMAAAALLMGYTTVQMRTEYETLSRGIENDSIVKDISEKFGREQFASALFDSSTARVILSPTDTGFHGQASVWMNADWSKARLFCQNLPFKKGQDYRLVALDKNNQVVRELARFESQGGVTSQPVEIESAGIYRLALVSTDVNRPASEGTAVLVSSPLTVG